jgi:hypothetical protein
MEERELGLLTLTRIRKLLIVTAIILIFISYELYTTTIRFHEDYFALRPVPAHKGTTTVVYLDKQYQSTLIFAHDANWHLVGGGSRFVSIKNDDTELILRINVYQKSTIVVFYDRVSIFMGTTSVFDKLTEGDIFTDSVEGAVQTFLLSIQNR